MKELIPVERIENKILLIRGHKVMLDRDLASLYGVTTGNFNKAVRRNMKRFPDDFMFQLTRAEYHSLRFHFGILKKGEHSKYLPFAFTEQGVAMLSGILNSDRAIAVNIQIMRTFVKLKRMIADNKDLSRRLDELEAKYDERFQSVFEAIRQLMAPPPVPPKRKIGFHS
jgi:hypothetical protein